MVYLALICLAWTAPMAQAAGPSPAADVMIYNARNCYLIIVLNGVPVYFENGKESGSGLVMDLSVFEKPGENTLSITAIAATPAKPSAADATIARGDKVADPLAKVKIQSEPGGKEAVSSATFTPAGPTHWVLERAEELKEFTADDKREILAHMALEIDAWKKKDATALLDANRSGADLMAKLDKKTIAAGEKEVKDLLDRAPRDFPKAEIQDADRLRVIAFSRGALVVAQDYQPIVRLTNPEKGDKAEGVSVWARMFVRINSKWVAVK